jgi:hypothetical protein
MIIPKDAIIAEEKIRDYLLTPLDVDDKSGYLSLAGYTRYEYWELMRDIREQLLPGEADFHRSDKYGEYFSLEGFLKGPNSRSLGIRTIWQRTNHGVIRFITLYPKRRRTEHEV